MSLTMAWTRPPLPMVAAANLLQDQQDDACAELEHAERNEAPGSPRIRRLELLCEDLTESLAKAYGYMFNIGSSFVALRDVMERAGMVFTDDVPPPPWPRYEDYGIDWGDPRWKDAPYAELAERPEGAAYDKASLTVATWHHQADRPGIPLHKLSSSEGWIVSAAEAVAAIRAWEASGARLDDEIARDDYYRTRWHEWLTFLAGSTRHGGFHVD